MGPKRFPSQIFSLFIVKFKKLGFSSPLNQHFLENLLFFINILKIAVSARRSVIRFQRVLYFWVEISFFYSAIFVGGGARFGFCPPVQGNPRYATSIHTTGF